MNVFNLDVLSFLAVDATLATLDARPSFTDRLRYVLSLVHQKNNTDSEKEISIAENENI